MSRSQQRAVERGDTIGTVVSDHGEVKLVEIAGGGVDGRKATNNGVSDATLGA